MANSGELYYLIGKPNLLKHSILQHITASMQNDCSVLVAKTNTTNDAFVNDPNYCVISESDFGLRNSMGLYCLNWQKKGHNYGIGGEIQQLINRGNNVLLNGSLQNIEQALKLFPLMNVVMIKYETKPDSGRNDGYSIVENDGARLDWISEANGVYGPFVLTAFDENAHQSVAELLLKFVLFDPSKLDKAV